MTVEEFTVIRTELERLSMVINQAVRQIAEQAVEINALQYLLEEKEFASQEELDRARDEAARQLTEGPHQPGNGDAGNGQMRRPRPVNFSKRCKSRI